MTRATRSATGNSKPRVIQVIDTAPTITRKAPTKKKVATKTEATGAKPTGITKKKKAPKKDSTVAKVKAAVKKTAKKATATEKKTEEKAEKAEKEVKPKTTAKK
jgi:hypothetical protein